MHACAADNSPATDAALGESCRHIQGAGSLAFDLSCDPNKQNYLTVKFWGSDAEVATIFLCVGDKRIGKYGDDWPELDLGMVARPSPTASITPPTRSQRSHRQAR